MARVAQCSGKMRPDACDRECSQARPEIQAESLTVGNAQDEPGQDEEQVHRQESISDNGHVLSLRPGEQGTNERIRMEDHHPKQRPPRVSRSVP